MRLNEFIDKGQLTQIQNILGSTLQAISQLAEIQARQYTNCQSKLSTKSISKAKLTPKTKATLKPKKAPYAAAPKPLPKPKPPIASPSQIKTQQHNSSTKSFVKPLPKSLQPLPTNIISPIGAVDSELQNKLELARRQGEQNRASGSEPQLIHKNPNF